MASREEIAQNLTALHAEQNRRARWVWAVLAALTIAAAVAAYRALTALS